MDFATNDLLAYKKQIYFALNDWDSCFQGQSSLSLNQSQIPNKAPKKLFCILLQISLQNDQILFCFVLIK